MKQITRQSTIVTTPGIACSSKAPVSPTRCGVIMIAIGCALFAQTLWADGPTKEITSESAAMILNESPPAAVTEKAAQPVVRNGDRHDGWKPPEMPEPVAYSTQKLDPEVVKEMKEQWGVEVLGMRRTAAGNFLDFRFKVLDADKALPLFDHRIKPHIVAERSNIKLPVPMAAKVGAFRPTNRGKNIKPDKTYYMIFGNPDRHVKAGEMVTVVIGDFKVEHLMVN